MEWKEGNISTARELYQKALAIDSTTESAARCLQVTIKVNVLLSNTVFGNRRLKNKPV